MKLLKYKEGIMETVLVRDFKYFAKSMWKCKYIVKYIKDHGDIIKFNLIDT